MIRLSYGSFKIRVGAAMSLRRSTGSYSPAHGFGTEFLFCAMRSIRGIPKLRIGRFPRSYSQRFFLEKHQGSLKSPTNSFSFLTMFYSPSRLKCFHLPPQRETLCFSANPRLTTLQ